MPILAFLKTQARCSAAPPAELLRLVQLYEQKAAAAAGPPAQTPTQFPSIPVPGATGIRLQPAAQLVQQPRQPAVGAAASSGLGLRAPAAPSVAARVQQAFRQAQPAPPSPAISGAGSDNDDEPLVLVAEPP